MVFLNSHNRWYLLCHHRVCVCVMSSEGVCVMSYLSSDGVFEQPPSVVSPLQDTEGLLQVAGVEGNRRVVVTVWRAWLM